MGFSCLFFLPVMCDIKSALVLHTPIALLSLEPYYLSLSGVISDVPCLHAYIFCRVAEPVTLAEST
jgi:hypothetical protein